VTCSSVVFCQDHGPISPDNLAPIVYLLVRGSRARNSSPGIGTTSPAPPLVAGDLAPSSVGARRASSDPDLATARNTLFWPSDRRHCPVHTSSSGDAVAAGLQLRARGVFFAALRRRSSCAFAVRGLEDKSCSAGVTGHSAAHSHHDKFAFLFSTKHLSS